MADSYVQGYTVAQFSDEVLNLQSSSFCCGCTGDNKKFVRFFKNMPSVLSKFNTYI